MVTSNSVDAGRTPDEWFQYVIDKADTAKQWYTVRIKKKRWKALLFLFLTIVLTSAAGLLPIIAEIYKSSGGEYPISPAWASALLGLSATLLAWDRIGDLTSGWIRFIRAAQEIEKLREGFVLDWAAKTIPQTPPDSELIILCRTFHLEVLGIVSKETSEWAAAFQSALTELAKATKEEVQVKKPGAINVIVTNGDEAENGWHLTVNGAGKKRHIGQQAVVSGLAPGVHVVKIEGKVAGSAKAAASAVTVPAGAVTEQRLTLT